LLPWFNSIEWKPEAVTAAATIVLAILTLVLAVSTVFLWLATRGTLKLARAEFNASHRPKLIVRELMLLRGAGLEPTADVRYVIANIGDGPAEIVESYLICQLVSDGTLSPLQPIEGANPIGRETINPGAHIFREETSNFSHRSIAINYMKSQHGQIHDHFFFRGFIIYQDRMGIRRRTAFSRAYDPEARRFRLSDDPDYEYAD
jgi:hypothetical protein